MPRRNNNYRQNNQQAQQLPKIDFNYENNHQIFGKVANEWAKRIESESSQQKNKSSQIRQFYDRLLQLYENSQNTDENDYMKKIYPFVVMLNSKVAYAKNRNKVSNTFEKMINTCVEQANSKSNLEVFQLFFEAVIGFYPKK